MYGTPATQDPDSAVGKVARCVITDSRNVYDKLRTEVLSIKGAEKESNIELLSLKEAQARTKVIMRLNWATRLLDTMPTRSWNWSTKSDPHMRSARKRRTEGLGDTAGWWH